MPLGKKRIAGMKSQVATAMIAGYVMQTQWLGDLGHFGQRRIQIDLQGLHEIIDCLRARLLANLAHHLGFKARRGGLLPFSDSCNRRPSTSLSLLAMQS